MGLRPAKFHEKPPAYVARALVPALGALPPPSVEGAFSTLVHLVGRRSGLAALVSNQFGDQDVGGRACNRLGAP
jgi:hypothetical protein